MPSVYVCQFSGLTHLDALPLAAGQVVAAARASAVVSTTFDIEILIERREPDATVDRFENPSLLAFSCYPWSTRYALEVARRAKRRFPDCPVVLGGPSVPRRPEAIERLLRQNDAIDVLVLGEGEVAFRELLEAVAGERPLDDVAGLALRSREGDSASRLTAPRERLGRLSHLPSPFLDGTFDRLIERCGPVFTAALLETNRGCPFSCAFCDWGQATRSAVVDLPIERVQRELDWVAEHGIPYVYIVDANFGIRRRDVDIARHVADLRRRSGQPQYCFFHLRKNARETDLQLVETLLDAGVGCQVTLSTQDFDSAVLSAITRSNLDAERSLALRRACNQRHIPTFNELLIGLPEQTPASFRRTVAQAISPYPGDSFFVYPVRLVENAALSTPEFRQRFAIETRDCQMTAANPRQREYHVEELEEIVVATSSMPVEDWRRAVELGYLAEASVNLGLLDIVIRFVQGRDDLELESFFEALRRSVAESEDGTALATLRTVLERWAESVLSGGPLFVEVASAYGTRLRVADALACAALEHADRFFDEVCAVARSYAARGVDATRSDGELDALLIELFRFQRFVTPTYVRKQPEEEAFDHDWLAYCQSAAGSSTLEPVSTTLRYQPPYYLVAASTFGQFALAHLTAMYTRRGLTTAVRV